VLASPVASPRIGIVVPLHRQTAVARNRLKRRLRELVRIELLPALRRRTAVDVAIRARREAYAADLSALRRDVFVIHRHFSGDEPVVI
jgi:ribonuclease P protein component